MKTGTAPSTIFELRQYTLRPGRRDDLIDLFEREFVDPQLAAGIALAGLFRDAGRPDRFVWIRAFADMEARRIALSAFYDGPVWRAHRDEANATMIDSDNVLLLRPAAQSRPPASGTFRGPLIAATYFFDSAESAQAFAEHTRCGSIVSAFVTEYSANTFPRLPVREGEHAVVFLTDGLEPEQLAQFGRSPDEVARLIPTRRSRMQLESVGERGDFDFLTGNWTVHHRRLRERLSKCTDWLEETGRYRGCSFADGVLSVDEFEFPSRGIKGCSIRTLDLAMRRWTIHWTTSDTGYLFAPVHGGFSAGRGEFYGNDVCDDRPVLARYLWLDCGTAHPRWEQAFSTDGGVTWETNWTMEFDRAQSCSF